MRSSSDILDGVSWNFADACRRVKFVLRCAEHRNSSVSVVGGGGGGTRKLVETLAHGDPL